MLTQFSCGYVLQSEVLKQTFAPTTLKVRVLGALHLPKLRTAISKGEDAGVSDVTATVSVHSGEESTEFKTKPVSTRILFFIANAINQLL